MVFIMKKGGKRMKYGFIGLGNMASAIIEGMAASGKFKDDNLFGYNRSEAKTLALKEKHGLIPCRSASELARRAEVIVLAVKPQTMEDVLSEIAPVITPDKTVISIAAGKTTDWYEERLCEGAAVVRVMPNLNAKVKAAVTALCGGKNAEERQLALADGIFSTVGKVYRIEEDKFDVFSAIGGSSGAFVLMYIDALSEAGVRAGFSRSLSEELAAATVVGSGLMCMNSDEHPVALMNRVCSPGGTTIEGVMKLRELGFDSAVQQALAAVIEKNSSL